MPKFYPAGRCGLFVWRKNAVKSANQNITVTPSVAQAGLLQAVAGEVGCKVDELILGLAMGLIESSVDNLERYPAELVERFALPHRRRLPETATTWGQGRFVRVRRPAAHVC